MNLEWLCRVLNAERREIRALFWSFFFFFLVLCSYYILRSIREEMGITGGIRNLPWMFTATFGVMLLAMPLYGWLVSRFPRRQFLPWVYLFFVINLLVFWFLMTSGVNKAWLARVFFVWTSVFSLFIVSVFWSFMADIYADNQAKRLFAFIAAGGTVGAITGPLITTLFVQHIGVSSMLLISAGLLLCAWICIVRLTAWQRGSGQAAEAKPDPQAREILAGGILDGIRLIVRSPYLLGICLLMLLFTMLSTFLYFQQAYIVKAHFADSAHRTAVFARIDLAVNVLTILFQVLITGRLVRRFGLGVVLIVVPLAMSLGFIALGLYPVLIVLVVMQVVRRAGNYAIMRPGREMLYVVLKREEKYKAKNVIDTVVYRGGDAVAGWTWAGFQAMGMSLSTIAFVSAPIAIVWAAVAFALGRRQEQLAKDKSTKNETTGQGTGIT